MKIGILVGETKDGYETIGKIGEIKPLDAAMRKIVDAGGVITTGKTQKQYTKLILSNLSSNPIKMRKI